MCIRTNALKSNLRYNQLLYSNIQKNEIVKENDPDCFEPSSRNDDILFWHVIARIYPKQSGKQIF